MATPNHYFPSDRRILAGIWTAPWKQRGGREGNNFDPSMDSDEMVCQIDFMYI